MDNLTHALLGGLVAQTFAPKEKVRRAALVGALAGMTPDLDVLISSQEHPIVSLEYHRQFTHSLFMIVPLGALVGCLLWLLWLRRDRLGFFIKFSILGYGTHGLLDACTSYGTLLYWPFSMERVSWDSIAIIDLAFSIPLLIGFLAILIRRARKMAFVCMFVAAVWLAFGFYQNNVGKEIQLQIAEQRGHSVTRGRVMPTLTNLFLWRSVYENNDQFYADAIWFVPGKTPRYWEGGGVRKFKPSEITFLKQNSPLAKDIAIYSWFTDDYMYRVISDSSLIGDLRYSYMPQELSSIWAMEIPDSTDKHLTFGIKPHLSGRDLGRLWQMILGNDGKELENVHATSLGSRSL